MSDVLERLRAADPVVDEPDAPPVEWMLARVDAAAASPPVAAWEVADAAPRDTARSRRAFARPAPRRRPLLAGLAVATGLAAAVVLAGTSSSPDVVAEASEALGAQGAIVHTVTIGRTLDANGDPTGPDEIMTGRKARYGENSAIQYERWSAQNPLRQRSRVTVESEDGGKPGIQDMAYADGVLRVKASWTSGKVRIIRIPRRLQNQPMLLDPVTPGPDPVDGIRELLANQKLQSAGEVTVAGRQALSLRGEYPSEKLKDGRRTPTVRIEYLVDPETFEPLRIDHRLYTLRNGQEVATGGSRVTFKTYERLPLTAANLALLKLPR